MRFLRFTPRNYNSAMVNNKTVFVTVGTTEFNELIASIDCIEFLKCLKGLGFNKINIQIGRGSYEPSLLLLKGSEYEMQIDFYRFKPSLETDIASADLIISHCGAGSILEAVMKKKMLVVVINTSLQDNHQTELSDALTSRNYCLSTVSNELISSLYKISNCNIINFSNCNSFPINNPNYFNDVLNKMYEFDG